MKQQTDNVPAIYTEAAETIKTAILQGQYEALKGENRIQLAVYFGIGRYISINTRNGKWGSGALKQISGHLRRILPGLRGFSDTQMKEMRLFYEAWVMLESNSSVATDELKNVDDVKDLVGADNSIDIYHSMSIASVADFPVDDFFRVPFTHQCVILRGAKMLEERYYYIRRCAAEHLSVDALKRIIKQDDYHNQDAIPNNFSLTLTGKEARKAVMMFKDEYALDFINVEEIGERDSEDIDERVVEHFPDLLFFNRELNAMVCVELKTGSFKPGYLGQLMAYLRILDDHVKKPHENPSIGIVLCKEADKEYVEYVIQDYNKPMGVATYTTSADMPEKLRNALPDSEELKKLL